MVDARPWPGTSQRSSRPLGRRLRGRLLGGRHVRPSGGLARRPRTAAPGRRACTAASSQRSRVPSSSCTARMSAPPSRRCVANECRRVCGVTRRPGSSRTAISFHHRTDIPRAEGLLRAIEEERRGRPGRPAAGRPVAQVGARAPPPRSRTSAPRAPWPPCPCTCTRRPIEVDPVDREGRDLTHPQPRAVQELEHGAIAQRDGRSTGRTSRRLAIAARRLRERGGLARHAARSAAGSRPWAARAGATGRRRRGPRRVAHR